MRRLVFEISEEEAGRFDGGEASLLGKIKSYEILRLLRFDPEEFAAVIRIEFKESPLGAEDILSASSLGRAKIQLLDSDRNGACTYFLRGIPRQGSEERKVASLGVYLSAPFEIRDGKIKMGFLGDTKQVKALLETFHSMGLRYKIVSLADADFPPDSPLSYLTEKQRMVLTSAFEQGYYETPRRISSQELAKRLNLKSSTLVEHRRKAEQRLLARIIEES